MSENVLLTIENGIAEIVLNNPNQHNAITLSMRNDLYNHLIECETSQEVKVILLYGAGKSFCSGNSVNTMGEKTVVQTLAGMQQYSDIIMKIFQMEKPVIAAVQGYAIGAGCGLALSADYIISAPNGKFGFPFSKLGLMPDCGTTYFVPKLVGIQKAKEWFMTGANVGAEEAEQRGMINRVVDQKDLLVEARKFATQLSEGPSHAISMIKKITNMSVNFNLNEVLELERSSQTILQQTSDHKEGVLAFKEKRKAEFKGE